MIDTAKGIVFCDDMMSTAIASFGGNLNSLYRQPMDLNLGQSIKAYGCELIQCGTCWGCTCPSQESRSATRDYLRTRARVPRRQAGMVGVWPLSRAAYKTLKRAGQRTRR